MKNRENPTRKMDNCVPIYYQRLHFNRTQTSSLISMKQEQRVWHRYIYTHNGITNHLQKEGKENVDIKTPCISPDNYIPVSTIKNIYLYFIKPDVPKTFFYEFQC